VIDTNKPLKATVNIVTKDDIDFDSWHDILCDVARENGGSATDKEVWREEYDKDLTPEAAWQAEWG